MIIVVEILIPRYINAAKIATVITVPTANPKMLAIGRSFKGFMKVKIPKIIRNIDVKVFASSAVVVEYAILGDILKISPAAPESILNTPTAYPNNVKTFKNLVISKSQSSTPVNCLQLFLLFASYDAYIPHIIPKIIKKNAAIAANGFKKSSTIDAILFHHIRFFCYIII